MPKSREKQKNTIRPEFNRPIIVASEAAKTPSDIGSWRTECLGVQGG
jgi:hypothetical protein